MKRIITTLCFVFGIGEIDLPSKDDNEVLLSGKIEQDSINSAQNESKCSQTGVFKITVTAIRLDKEQRTQKSVSEVTDVVNSTEDFVTLCNQTYDPLLIGIGVALVISVLLNIATFAKKISRKTVPCGNNSAESDQNRHVPQISEPSVNEDVEQRIHITLTPPEMHSAVEAGVCPHHYVNEAAEEQQQQHHHQQESQFALRCKKGRLALSAEGKQKFPQSTTLSSNADQVYEIVIKEMANLSEEAEDSHEYEPVAKVGQSSLLGGKSIPLSGDTTKERYKITAKTRSHLNHSQHTEGVSTQQTRQTYENLNTPDMFCSSGPSESGELHQRVDVADQQDDYMPLHKSGDSSDPIYQPLQV